MSGLRGRLRPPGVSLGVTLNMEHLDPWEIWGHTLQEGKISKNRR